MDFDNAIEKAKAALDVAVKTTSKAVSIQKQKFDIAAMENKLSAKYETLGRLYYQMNECGKDNESLISDLTAEIKNSLCEIASAQEELAKTKRKRICPACGASVEENSKFCGACGEQITFESDN